MIAETRTADGGDVAVNSPTNSLSVGNVEIARRLWTCPGVSNVFLGPQGRVGSLIWQVAGYASSRAGGEGTWVRQRQVELPAYFGAVPPGSGTGTARVINT